MAIDDEDGQFLDEIFGERVEIEDGHVDMLAPDPVWDSESLPPPPGVGIDLSFDGSQEWKNAPA